MHSCSAVRETYLHGSIVVLIVAVAHPHRAIPKRVEFRSLFMHLLDAAAEVDGVVRRVAFAVGGYKKHHKLVDGKRR